MQRIGKAFRRPPTGRGRNRCGGFPSLLDCVASALRCAASRHRTLLAKRLGKPSPWVIISETWYKKAAGEKCDAIEGLIEEAEGLMEEIDDADTLDAALAAAAQAVEHYEIARYGTLIAWARRLGQGEARDLLEENLKQEKNADELLTDIATDEVNAASAAA